MAVQEALFKASNEQNLNVPPWVVIRVYISSIALNSINVILPIAYLQVSTICLNVSK